MAGRGDRGRQAGGQEGKTRARPSAGRTRRRLRGRAGSMGCGPRGGGGQTRDRAGCHPRTVPRRLDTRPSKGVGRRKATSTASPTTGVSEITAGREERRGRVAVNDSHLSGQRAPRAEEPKRKNGEDKAGSSDDGGWDRDSEPGAAGRAPGKRDRKTSKRKAATGPGSFGARAPGDVLPARARAPGDLLPARPSVRPLRLHRAPLCFPWEKKASE